MCARSAHHSRNEYKVSHYIFVIQKKSSNFAPKIKNKMKPIPFRYPGGKFYALNILTPFWVNCPHDEYREPFVGGGSVFFTKEKTRFNVINDIDSELTTTYKVMQNPITRKQLLELVTKEIATKERWKEVFEFEPHNDLETAYRFFYLNRTSFSGKLISPAWGYREKRSLPPSRWGERIIPCGEKLKDVDIFNTDFEEIIKMPSKGKRVLMFIDPPYYKPKKKKHYRFGFEEEDHIRLANVLQNTKYSFFLTYEDTPEVRELYKWANIYEMKFFYRVGDSSTSEGRRQEGAELVITNYDAKLQTLFK